MNYLYKTKPFEKQKECFELSRQFESFALLMEMGVGKSKIIIDTAAWNFLQGNIDACIIIAPNGVHETWVNKLIPEHCPDQVNYAAVAFKSRLSAADKKQWAKVSSSDSTRLKFFTFHYESQVTANGKEKIRQLLDKFRCLMVLDESHWIRTPGNKRTKYIISISPYAKMRRILTGTVIANSPLDFYSQFKFLNPGITGHRTFSSYRSRYAVLENVSVNTYTGQRSFLKVVGYQNVDELYKRVRTHSFIALKSDCVDLPEKLYEPVEVYMTGKQQRLYSQLLEEGFADISGKFNSLDECIEKYVQDAFSGIILPKNILSVLTRLQQIVGGFVKDDLGNVHEVESNKLSTLLDVLSGIPTTDKVIIWARYIHEINHIYEALIKQYGKESAAMLYGETKNRTEIVESFQNGSLRFIIGNVEVGGTGITLTSSNKMIYYSNNFSAVSRGQSEDRIHRIGQNRAVTYIDLVTRGSIDEKIISTLNKKREILKKFMEQK